MSGNGRQRSDDHLHPKGLVSRHAALAAFSPRLHRPVERDHHREETDDDGKVRVHKAATAYRKGDLFTKELDRAKFEHAPNMTQMN